MDQRQIDEQALTRERDERRLTIFGKNLSQLGLGVPTENFDDLAIIDRLESERDFYVSFVKGKEYPYYYLLKEVDLSTFDNDPEYLQSLRENLEFWKVMSYKCHFFMRVYQVREKQDHKVLQVLFEYSPNESLEKSNRLGHVEDALDEDEIFTVFVEVLCVIEYLQLLGMSFGLFTPLDVQKRALRNYVLAPPIHPLTKQSVKLITEQCPGFVPPELQAVEDPCSVRSTASDIYCLGSLLYFLLEKTYPGEDWDLQFGESLDQSWEQIIQKMRKQNPCKRPSVQDIFSSKTFIEMAKKTRVDIQEKRQQVYKELGIIEEYFRNFRSKKTKKTNCGSKQNDVALDGSANLGGDRNPKKRSKPNSAKPMRFLSGELSEDSDDHDCLAETRSDSLEEGALIQPSQVDSKKPDFELKQEPVKKNSTTQHTAELFSRLLFFGSHLLTNLPLVINQEFKIDQA